MIIEGVKYTIADFLTRNKGKNEFLERVNKLINWLPIEKILKKRKKKDKEIGRTPYPDLSMFKILLLQSWFDLSDPKTEELLKDRISFIRFSGFSLSSDIPDHSTICRFRNSLLKKELYKKLLEEINTQLESKGFLLKTGAIVDATVVESHCHPQKSTKIVTIDREEEDGRVDIDIDIEVEYSKDSEAAWLKKGKKAYYGYKSHVASNFDGYILSAHLTSANKSDINQFVSVLDNLELEKGSSVLADKGYSSKSNREYLEKRQLEDGIMHKKAKNKEMSFFEYITNKFISKYRYVIEQSFGLLKHHQGLSRFRYIGKIKCEAEFIFKSLAFNIKKAVLSC